ncbi:MAG: PHP domain-containing protein [Clostridiales bacterium]|nr:PHP domain-containing protein [Clostridiales bacterium]
MMKLYYDLHIHSCLSLCAEDDMTPSNIANMSAVAGLSLIAVSDHQSALNCPAILPACKRAGILALPGMELCTREEVHVLCLFEELDGAIKCSDYVRNRLIQPKKKAAIQIRQTIMDCFDNPIGEETAYLGAAADIGIYEVSMLINSFGGVAIPAHIDRSSYSLLTNLAFYDPEMNFHAIEITKDCDKEKLILEHPELAGMRFIQNSDAHSLEAISDPIHYIEVDDVQPRSILRAITGKN